MRRKSFIALLLAGITLALYWPAGHFDLFTCDDPAFLTDNPEIQNGLNWHSLGWALTGTVAANWHPVTSLSFVVGHQLWGANPGAEHLVNAVIHALNAALLFLVMVEVFEKAEGRRQKVEGGNVEKDRSPLVPLPSEGRGKEDARVRAMWAGAVVAGLFAWHPLRVESVAWIAERKDVLCGFFFLLTLWAYGRYAQESGVHGSASMAHPDIRCRGSRFYWLAVVFFVLGLMSKAMLVTVPFVLLLLDVWPLNRSAKCEVRSAGFPSPHPDPLPSHPMGAERGKRASRQDASVRVRHFSTASLRGRASTWKRLLIEKIPFFALAAVVCIVTFLVQRGGAATPSLGELGPMLRLENIIASYWRYLAWTLWPVNLAAFYAFPFDRHDYLALWPGWQMAAAGLGLVAVSVLCLKQSAKRPYLAVGWFWYLGTLLPVIGLVQVGSQGMADRYTYIPLIGPVMSLVWLVAEKWPARIFYRGLLTVLTTTVLAASIAQTRHQLMFWRNTEVLFRHTIEVTGENPRAEFYLGMGLEREGRIQEALVHYRNAATSQPRVAEAFVAIARLFGQQGNWSGAAETYSLMLSYNPKDFTAHLGLAVALPHLGKAREAASHLQSAMQVCPNTPDALNNLAWTLAANADIGLRDGPRAVQFAKRACELTSYRETVAVGTLAAAYAEAGQFDEAVATAQKASALATELKQPDLLKRNQELLELYRQHKAYHEPALD